MRVTFGKWNGWDTEELAKTPQGRSYLEWGSENLKSPKWRKEFDRVLSEVSGYDLNLSTQAEITANPDVSPEEIEIWLSEEIEAMEEGEAKDKAFSDLRTRFAGYLQKNDVSQAGIHLMLETYGQDDMDAHLQSGRIQWGSPKREQIIMIGLRHFWAEMGKIY